MSLDKENILVLSYNENTVCVNGARDNYKFSPSNGIDPVINVMPLSDLQYINSNTQIIKTGWLTFEEESKEEIFKALRIAKWEDILTNQDIKDILTNPTMEGLQRIIDIDNPTYFDRVRIVLHVLIQDGVDITTKVKTVVDSRYKELLQRKRKSSISLTPKTSNVRPDKVKEIEQQNEALQAQLDEMKAMMAQLLASQNAVISNNGEVLENESADEQKTTKKKPGRPSSKKKS